MIRIFIILFNVVDLGFNSLFLKANKDLLKLLKKFNLNFLIIKKYINNTENNILKLYDKKKDTFFCMDLKNKKKYSYHQLQIIFFYLQI